MTSPATRTTPARPFGIADGLILVAALAAGLGVSRAIEPRLTPEVLRNEIAGTLSRGLSFDAFAVIMLEFGSILVMPGWGALTLAWLLIRLRGRRPSRRRLVRRPGTGACLVASLVIVACALAGFAQAMMMGADDPHRLERIIRIIGIGSIQTGVAVAWCWVTLALCGRWDPEPTWSDRLGRLLGATWILVALVNAYAVFRFWT